MVPAGFRFRPTEEELISLYLLKFVRGEDLPWDGIYECNIYGDKGPEEIFYDLDGEEKHYIFTRLKRVRRRVARTAGRGTWHESAGHQIFDKFGQQVIGFNKQFSFKAKEESCVNKCNWIMHEFSLAGASLVGEQEQSTDWVLCSISKKQSGTKRMRDQNMCSSVQVAKTVNSTNELLQVGEGYQDKKRICYDLSSDIHQAAGILVSFSPEMGTNASEFTPSVSSSNSKEDVEPEDIPPLTDLETHINYLPSDGNPCNFQFEFPLPQSCVENNDAIVDMASPESCLPFDDNADSEFHAPYELLSFSPESADPSLDSLWKNLCDDDFFDNMVVSTEELLNEWNK